MEETPVRAPKHYARKTCSVQIYPNGTITNKGGLEIPASKRRPRCTKRRSTIKGFSKASAARLRRLLATVRGPEGWCCFGLTLTVPGPNITIDEWRRLWKSFYSRIYRMEGIALIRRIELQERRQGRQWSIVSKHRLVPATPVVIELPEKALDKVIRYLKRLTHCYKASGHGRQTWFADPGTVMRLCEWAKREVSL